LLPHLPDPRPPRLVARRAPPPSTESGSLAQYPRLHATRLHEMLRQRGYPGSAVQVRRAVRRLRPAPPSEAYLRLATLPGEVAQVDWGHFGRIRKMHSQAFASDPRVNGMALGFYEVSSHARRIIAHAGGTQWFFSNLALVLAERLGIFVSFRSRSIGSWTRCWTTTTRSSRLSRLRSRPDGRSGPAPTAAGIASCADPTRPSRSRSAR
jgi:hypothetical protein